MRKLGTIVGKLSRIVSHARQNCSLRSPIALQFVGDHPERFLTLTLHQLAEEPLGGVLIAARLQQNINDIAVLIHGTPKIVLLAVDSDEEFVQIPGIAEAPLSPLQFSNVVWTELLTPASNRFIRDGDAPLSQQIFHITEAQTEAMIEPYGVADDFRRETMSAVTGSGALHTGILSVGFPT